MEREEVIKTTLENASPLEFAKKLEEIELYDKKQAQEVIDEVYKKFKSGEDMVDSIVKPVTLSIADGLLECCAATRALRRKGLTASRVVSECEAFSYPDDIVEKKDAYEEQNAIDGYVEYKNMRERMSRSEAEVINNEYLNSLTIGERVDESVEPNSDMSEYTAGNRTAYYDSEAGKSEYMDSRYGKHDTTKDEYLGKQIKRDDANTDHVIPIKQIHNEMKDNVALNNADIKEIANIKENYRITSQDFNKSKGALTNQEVVDRDADELKKWDKNRLLKTENEARQAVVNKANECVFNTLTLRGNVDTRLTYKERNDLRNSEKREFARAEKEKGEALTNTEKDNISKILRYDAYVKHRENFEKEYEKLVQQAEKENGTLTIAQKAEIKKNFRKEYEEKTRKELQLQKSKEVYVSLGNVAYEQTKDYACGNFILFLLKPLYYEMKDIVLHGLEKGVHTNGKIKAIKKRFNRVKDYVLANAGEFAVGSFWDFLKMFLSSLIEALINMFIGFFKMIGKIIKEAFKILVRSCKIIWGSEGKDMTSRQKGDAILKLIGGSVGALSGVAIDYMFSVTGMPGWLRVPISTIGAGFISAIIMCALHKMDLFSVRSEQRRMAIEAIFKARIDAVHKAVNAMNVTALNVLQTQEKMFDDIIGSLKTGLNTQQYNIVVEQTVKLSNFFRIELPYSSTDEFVKKYDLSDEIVIV